MKVNFLCISATGRTILNVWALSGNSAEMEERVCQLRLDRGDFARVLIWDESAPERVRELTKKGQPQ